MAYKLILAPSEEPLTIAEARAHLRVDFNDDDAQIGAMISAARQFAETYTQRQLVTAQWRFVLDRFPRMIRLDKSPLVTVDSIKYLDLSGVLQTMPSTDYVVDDSSEPARITPVFGKIWPIPVPQIGAVQINFTSGYGAAATVPEGIKHGIRLRLSTLYENRAEVEIVQRAQLVAIRSAENQLDQFCVLTV